MYLMRLLIETAPVQALIVKDDVDIKLSQIQLQQQKT